MGISWEFDVLELDIMGNFMGIHGLEWILIDGRINGDFMENVGKIGIASHQKIMQLF